MLPVAIGLAWAGGWWMAGLLVLLGVAAIREWVRLTDKHSYSGEWPIVALPLAVALALPVLDRSWTPWSFAWLGLCFVLLRTLAGIKHWPAPSATAAGLLVIGGPLVALLWLRGQPQTGLLLVLFLFLVTWANDIAAYFAGKLIGGPKLAPSISPKKTWSGALGGLAAGVATGYAFAVVGGSNAPLTMALLAGLLAVVGQIGDLVKSTLKRRSGVKDSGHSIPGHGGVLDRVDGLLAATAALALVVWLSGTAFGWR
jgi:phosphatidate cytidylyltransferase